MKALSLSLEEGERAVTGAVELTGCVISTTGAKRPKGVW
jgi:hypothetical protein